MNPSVLWIALPIYESYFRYVANGVGTCNAVVSTEQICYMYNINNDNEVSSYNGTTLFVVGKNMHTTWQAFYMGNQTETNFFLGGGDLGGYTRKF